jgi:hypothetical protein
MMTADSPEKSAFASVRSEIIMTSSDSGVVIRMCAGVSRNFFFRESATSPCHLKTSSPTMRAYDESRSSWLLSSARMGHT